MRSRQHVRPVYEDERDRGPPAVRRPRCGTPHRHVRIVPSKVISIIPTARRPTPMLLWPPAAVGQETRLINRPAGAGRSASCPDRSGGDLPLPDGVVDRHECRVTSRLEGEFRGRIAPQPRSCERRLFVRRHLRGDHARGLPSSPRFPQAASAACTALVESASRGSDDAPCCRSHARPLMMFRARVTARAPHEDDHGTVVAQTSPPERRIHPIVGRPARIA